MENIRKLCKIPEWIYPSWIIAIALFLASASYGYHTDVIPIERASISMMDIYCNNMKMFLTNVTGVFLLGIPNLISGFLNGYAAGEALHCATNTFGSSWIFKNFLPHGILEIPMIVLAVSFGMIPWIILYRKIRVPNQSLKRMCLESVKYLLFMLCLAAFILFLAAFIESYISMHI